MRRQAMELLDQQHQATADATSQALRSDLELAQIQPDPTDELVSSSVLMGSTLEIEMERAKQARHRAEELLTRRDTQTVGGAAQEGKRNGSEALLISELHPKGAASVTGLKMSDLRRTPEESDIQWRIIATYEDALDLAVLGAIREVDELGNDLAFSHQEQQVTSGSSSQRLPLFEEFCERSPSFVDPLDAAFEEHMQQRADDFVDPLDAAFEEHLQYADLDTIDPLDAAFEEHMRLSGSMSYTSPQTVRADTTTSRMPSNSTITDPDWAKAITDCSTRAEASAVRQILVDSLSF